MTILGIDPGLRNSGYCILNVDKKDIILVTAGEIETKPGEKRLLKIFNHISDLMNNYKPDVCVIETTFVNNNPKTSLILAQARAIAIVVFEYFNCKYVELAPTIIKKMISGSGICPKEQIQLIVKRMFGIELPHNAADATAIALTIACEPCPFLSEYKFGIC